MKHIKTIVIFLLCFACSLSVNALEQSEYGSWRLNDSFEVEKTLTTYPYNLQYSTDNDVAKEQLISYSTNEARSGAKSIRLNLLLLDVGDSVGFVRTLHGSGLQLQTERTYVSFYVKGANLTKEDIELAFTYVTTKNGSRIKGSYDSFEVENADANGWYKVNVTIPAIFDYNNNESGLIGPNFVKRSGGPTAIYIDDFKVCHLPSKIEFKQRNIPADEAFNLDKMQATAYNKEGHIEDLPNSGITQWEVVQGNAVINGRMLTVNSGSEVVIKGTFFDVSDEVTLYTTSNVAVPVLKPNLSTEKITEADGAYSVKISNTGEGKGTASLIASVYENGRLDRVYAVSGEILPGQSKTFEIQKIIETEAITVKVMVWDSIFGCITIR